MKKNKTAAMEMSIGTIVTIVLLMTTLILGLVLVRYIFKTSTESVETIDGQVKSQLLDLFESSGKKLVVGLGSQNTAKIKQGTYSFGIPLAFSPDNPQAWGPTQRNCKYNITAQNQPTYCINKGWANPTASILTGFRNVDFDEVDSTAGYALIKIDVPETVQPCLQRFSVRVMCAGTAFAGETSTSYFDVEVIKKGLSR